jgi:hypothetical protein
VVRIGRFLLAGALAAQAAQEVRIRSGPYAPPATMVRDRKGQLVGGLTRDDFELADNGRPRAIPVFATEQHAGMPAAAVLSRVRIPPRKRRPRARLRSSSTTCASGLSGWLMQRSPRIVVENGMRPGDRLGIYTGSGDVRIKTHLPRGPAGNPMCPTLTPYT